MVTDDYPPISSLSLSSDHNTTTPPVPSIKPSSTSTTSATPSPPPPSSKPLFHPPLWLARRTFCLNALRTEGIRSVLDLGCGTGTVLSLLTSPAHHLDDFPSLYPPPAFSSSPSSPSVTSPAAQHRLAKLNLLRLIPRVEPNENELHLRRVVGLDVRKEVLERAKEVVRPLTKEEEQQEQEGSNGAWGVKERERWEELRVELWEGGLEAYNETFEGIEAVVATEVIEHLTEPQLAKFSSLILGVYQPRLVVVTTPNHEFNPYFVASGAVEESQHRFKDPTGRTERVFRDDDHQFEWTQAEFEDWANKIADQNDYSVAFSGVGSLTHYYNSSSPPHPPPSLSAHPSLSVSSTYPPPNPSEFYATQCATFRRIYPNEPERSPRSHRPVPLPFFSSSPSSGTPPSPTTTTTNGTQQQQSQQPSPARPTILKRRSTYSPAPHTLYHTSLHPSHPTSSLPSSPSSLLSLLRKIFTEELSYLEGRVGLRQVWGVEEVRKACGGLVGAVVEAVVEEGEGEWGLERVEEGRGMEGVRIVWEGWVGEAVGEGEGEGEKDGRREDGEEEDELSEEERLMREEEVDVGQWSGEEWGENVEDGGGRRGGGGW